MKILELLAPARNADIGIAAIDCGADAVYMAGAEFGARKDAGNSMEDVARLCEYAHRFGARIFLTVNTIIYDGELERAHALMLAAQEAGVDAFIVQDHAVTRWDDIRVPLHASTQCAIRTPEDARFLESLGYSRLVLERETSMETLQQIRAAVGCELEFFVHGALCVCYSGQCYLSERLAGRSANRGACIQACRSLYDLVDDEGRILVRNKALLSLKDYRLLDRLGDLADAGVCSFKIEGRLKNASYVKNVVREYSTALDALVAARPEEYRRASFGRVSGGFTPAADKTFNRGYTSLWIDGKRGKWSSMDAPKSMGEFVGTVRTVRSGRGGCEIVLSPADGVRLNNGDGFAFAGRSGAVIGFRGDVCEGNVIRCKPVEGLRSGLGIYRNINAAFERELERNMPRREIPVTLDVEISGKYNIGITATSEDGRTVVCPFNSDLETAENRERQEAMIREQLAKRSGHYAFRLGRLDVRTAGGSLPLMSASLLNGIRRLVASDLDALPCKCIPMEKGRKDPSVQVGARELSYKYNVANAEARALYAERGAESVAPAYELAHPAGAELMRTCYCIRYELGMCPVHQGAKESRPLFLLNNGRRLALHFDCAKCEMTVTEDS